MLLVLAKPFAYIPSMEHAFLRSTGLAGFAPMVLGSALACWAALRHRRVVAGMLAGGALAFTGLAVYAFIVVSALPAPAGTLAEGQAPDFTLPDQTGQPVTLREARAAGPVLVAFYRGFW